MCYKFILFIIFFYIMKEQSSQTRCIRPRHRLDHHHQSPAPVLVPSTTLSGSCRSYRQRALDEVASHQVLVFYALAKQFILFCDSLFVCSVNFSFCLILIFFINFKLKTKFTMILDLQLPIHNSLTHQLHNFFSS